jgi:hypothetical protein
MATETTTPEVEQKDAAATETAAPTEIEYDQPDTKKHVYNSIEPKGYKVEVNKDRKSWTATGPEGVIGAEFVNRQGAYDAVLDVVYPDRKANAKPEKPKQQINAREKAVLAFLTTQTTPQTYDQIEKVTEIKYDVVLGVLSNLSRRKFVTLSKEGSMITDLGKAAEQSYVAPIKAVTSGPRTKTDARTHDEAMVARYGPRPEGLGPSLSTEEMYEIRLKVAEASLLMSEAIHRNNPYSAAAAARHQGSKDAVALAQKELEMVKRGETPPKRESNRKKDKEATPAENQDPEQNTENLEDGSTESE